MRSIDYKGITLESLGTTRLKLKLLSVSMLPSVENALEERHVHIQCLHIGHGMSLKTPFSGNVAGRLLQNYFKLILWEHRTYINGNRAALDGAYAATIAISTLYDVGNK